MKDKIIKHNKSLEKIKIIIIYQFKNHKLMK